jgi:16S rRNA (uracil1498-N3)-methyltransferase
MMVILFVKIQKGYNEKERFLWYNYIGDIMQRYFIESTQINNNEITIIGNDNHHIKNVMRMKIGDEIICCDNFQNVYLTKIKNISDIVTVEIIGLIDSNNELGIDITIAHGLVRREKTEEVIRRMTELGGYQYIPLEMKRSVVRAKYDKTDRWGKLVKEASEQSERNRLMKISEAMTMKQLLNQPFDLKLFADFVGEKDSFMEAINDFKGKTILVIVGPEGGFDDSERTLLLENNFKAISLGNTVLRTETAPLFIMSVLNYELGVRK